MQTCYCRFLPGKVTLESGQGQWDPVSTDLVLKEPLQLYPPVPLPLTWFETVSVTCGSNGKASGIACLTKGRSRRRRGGCGVVREKCVGSV